MGRLALLSNAHTLPFDEPPAAPPDPDQGHSAAALAPAVRQRAGAGAGGGHARRPAPVRASSPTARASSSGSARGAALLRRRRTAAPAPARTGKCCPTTCSRPIRTSSRNACETLFELPHATHGCLIVAADTLMQRLPPRHYVQARAFELKVGQALALEPFRQRLVEAGYASVSQVVEPRGVRRARLAARCLPDGHARSRCASTCSMMRSRPSARFDPETQRSLDSLESVRLLPAREVPLDAEAVKEFRRRYRTRFEGDPTQVGDLPRRERGAGPAGHRVLPAAVLRSDRHAVRLPAAQRRDRSATRHCPSALATCLARRSRHATRTAGTTSSARCCRRRNCSSSRRSSSAALARLRLRDARCLQGRHRADRGSSRGAQLPHHRPARAADRRRAPSSRSRRSTAS